MPRNLFPSPGGVPRERVIVTSTSFVAPENGDYIVTAIGAGASGARRSSSTAGVGATGGGSGGLARKQVSLSKGDVLVCTLGSGGAAVTAYQTNGNDGGTTTVVGPGISLTANGGQGGFTAAPGIGTIPGAAGGTASGGDLNVTGGGSGSATIPSTTTGTEAYTGGGAVGIYGTGYASGNAIAGATKAARSGGAGVGGSSGIATATSVITSTKGGSPFGPSPDNTNAPTGADPFAPGVFKIDQAFGYGIWSVAPGPSAVPAEPAAGWGGTDGQVAGRFAGGGKNTGSGGPGLGGGSSGNGDYATVAGGNGVVVIEWMS